MMAPLDHLIRLTDDCGIWQHARHAVPDRRHGYCLDDVARALWLCGRRAKLDPANPMPKRLAAVYASFVDHAWQAEGKLFLNFLSHDRQWIGGEDEDASARTIFALAEVAASPLPDGLVGWARDVLQASLPLSARLASPRGWAWALGALRRAAELGIDIDLDGLAKPLAGRLLGHWTKNSSADWLFFEPYLAYDSPRLAQGALDGSRWVPALAEAGLASLGWLSKMQTDPSGRFRPPGSGSYGRAGRPAVFAQQPLDVWAQIEAAHAAFDLTGEHRWTAEAHRAHAWFLGQNEANKALMTDEGGCHDGIDPQGISANQGAESTLAWLHADAVIRMFQNGAPQ